MAKYTKEFKEEAVRLVKEEGISQNKVAKLIEVDY
jgi:transposase-like protein